MNRAVAILARASSMGAVFAFGAILTLTAPINQSATFFVSYASVTILIVILGLELHTYTDRELARDMGPKPAIMGLFKLQTPWIVLVTILIVPFGSVLGVDLSHMALIVANAIVGLAAQECFRMFVALGNNQLANLSMVGRTTLPYVILIVLVLSGFSIEVTTILWIWLLGGVAATAFSVAKLWRSPLGDQRRQFSAKDAFQVARTYFPSTLIARGMLSLDVILIGLVASPALLSAYGNGANIAAAFFTFADLAIIQWRFRTVIRNSSSRPPDRKIIKGSFVIGIFSGTAIGLFAFGVSLGVFGETFSAPGLVPVLCLLAIASTAAIVVQAEQVLIYANNRDNRILTGYILSGTVFAAFAVLSLLLQDPLYAVAGRAGGFALLASYFHFVLRKGH